MAKRTIEKSLNERYKNKEHKKKIVSKNLITPKLDPFVYKFITPEQHAVGRKIGLRRRKDGIQLEVTTEDDEGWPCFRRGSGC